MAMLLQDKAVSDTDSIQEDWARPEKRDELLSQLKIPAGSLSLKITDLMGLIQVNALVTQPDGKDFVQNQEDLWDRFLRPVVSAQDNGEINATTDIIDCLKDWMDKNDDDAITGLNGAESDYYQGLDPPYKARNGPMRDVSELLLVKGVTPDIYFGTDKSPGIAPYVTTYGAVVSGSGESATLQYPGKINISTAPLAVLKALLPPENADLAQALADFREAKDGDTFVNDLTQATWYKNAPGCSELTIDPKLLTVTSDVFEVTASAAAQGVTSTVSAVVERVKNAEGAYSCRIRSWKQGPGTMGVE
jgi:general secretion pathway protein K